MVLPELEFDTKESTILKFDEDTSTYVKYLDQVHTIYEKNTIQISVVITNTGTATATDVDIEFSATLDNVPVKTEEDTITVLYTTSGLEIGTYTGTIRVSDPNALNTPQDIDVALEVDPLNHLARFELYLLGPDSRKLDSFKTMIRIK